MKLAKRGVLTGDRVPVTCPCGKSFDVLKSRYEAGRGRRCSKECQYKYMVRPKGLSYVKHKENPTSFKKGERASPQTEFSVRQIPWNKDVVHENPVETSVPGYDYLHKKVKIKYGAAKNYSCKFKDATCSGPMHWANISHEYKNVDDFFPLCQLHHGRYDRGLI